MPGVLDKLVEWLKMYTTTDRTLTLPNPHPHPLPNPNPDADPNPTPTPNPPTRYKTTEGKGVNFLTSDTPKTALEAAAVVAECHASWKALKARGAGDTGFWLG